MYGIVEIQGHQYKVKAGDIIDVEKLKADAGTSVDFDKVLFIGGEQTQVGLPTVNGAKITAKVIKHERSRKIIIFHRKPGIMQKKRGHRQHYSALLITEINDGSGNTTTIDPKSKTAEKFLN